MWHTTGRCSGGRDFHNPTTAAARAVTPFSETLFLGLVGMAMLCAPALLSAAEPASGDTAQAGAAASVAPGDTTAAQTLDIPRNTWVRVEPEYLPFPGGGRHRPQSWNKLVYDPTGQRAVFIDRWSDAEHGHSIYANAVLVFDPSANQVECRKVSHWKAQGKEAGGYSTLALPGNADDPTPCDRHPYGNVAFVPEQNSVYLSTGANRTALDGATKSHRVCHDTWRFDLTNNKWIKIDSDEQPLCNLEEVMCYDPSRKQIVRLAAGGEETWLLDIETGQWRNAEAKNNPRCGMAASMCYDSKRGRVMVFGARGQKNPDAKWNTPGVEAWSYSAQENTWQPLADSPLPFRAAGVDYDAKRDCVVVHARRGAERGQPGRTLFYLCDKDEWRVMPSEIDDRGPTAVWQGLTYDTARDLLIRTTYQVGGSNVPEWWLMRPDLDAALPADSLSGK